MTEPAEYYRIEEQSRQAIDRLLRPLSDEQLERVYDLFHSQNRSGIPFTYWGIANRVRAHVSREMKRRQEKSEK